MAEGNLGIHDSNTEDEILHIQDLVETATDTSLAQSALGVLKLTCRLSKAWWDFFSWKRKKSGLREGFRGMAGFNLFS